MWGGPRRREGPWTCPHRPPCLPGVARDVSPPPLRQKGLRNAEVWGWALLVRRVSVLAHEGAGGGEALQGDVAPPHGLILPGGPAQRTCTALGTGSPPPPGPPKACGTWTGGGRSEGPEQLQPHEPRGCAVMVSMALYSDTGRKGTHRPHTL